MTLSRKCLEERAADLMRRMFLAMRPQVPEGSPLGELTMSQFRLLLLLRALGPLRISDISPCLGVGTPTVSVLVSKLEEKGLAAREHDIQDRRVVMCSATEEGLRAAEELWRIRRERMEKIIDSLSDEELELVVHAAEVLLRAMQQQGHNASACGVRSSSGQGEMKPVRSIQ